MAVDWDAIREEYETTAVSLIGLAEKYGLKYPTVKSRKQRHKWKKNASRKQRDAPKRQKDALCKHPDAINKDAKELKLKASADAIKEIQNQAPELTEKQVLFVAEYLTDFNATRAAIAVGYSKKGASVTGFHLLRNPKIQVEIRRQTELVTMELGVTSQRVLLEYLKIAFADLSDFIDYGNKEVLVGVNKQGKPVTKSVGYLDLKDSDQVDGTVIQEIRHSKTGGVTIKLHDKLKALEKLEKYLDLLPDHHQRMVQEEKLRLERERLEHTKEIDRMKVF